MNLHVSWPISLAALLVACGGTISKSDGGSAGTANSGSSGSQAGASVGGSSSGVGGSSSSVGGSSGTAGNPSLGGERSSCEDVTCRSIEEECTDGYELGHPPGACCAACMPKPGGVYCNEIGCLSTRCPVGYVRGDRVGGCCYDCFPDPLYCREDADCVLADKPRACCGCAEAITRRQFEAEPCWSQVGSPRSVPPTCYPTATCDAVCAPCSAVGLAAVCSQNRCVAHDFGLK
jgi:hypothetical protein